MTTKTQQAPVLARTPEEWEQAMIAMGERAFHGKQVFRWVQSRGVVAPEQMSDLPAGLRTKLALAGVGPVLEPSLVQHAKDGTRKLLLRLKDGFSVESVLIPSVTSPRASTQTSAENPAELDADAAACDTDELEEDGAPAGVVRVTQCISTQVGCAMGCVFCASGVAGLKRHMSADEIIAQILEGRKHLTEGEELRNVVLMGMGEPLHNYDATARALKLMTHQDGIRLSSRRVAALFPRSSVSAKTSPAISASRFRCMQPTTRPVRGSCLSTRSTLSKT
jgi:23S rRNA (adenine2503-C2)-methyltransferase